VITVSLETIDDPSVAWVASSVCEGHVRGPGPRPFDAEEVTVIGEVVTVLGG
jgi:hypothetical protein